MGPVNWLGVVLAAAVAWLVNLLWHRVLFRPRRMLIASNERQPDSALSVAVILVIAAIMLGHFYARIGVDMMKAKPWLYFMQSGGLAIAFVIPAVWLTQRRSALEPMRRLLDCVGWLVVYLAMGTVFWALG
ncbi:DUF1761 domain-containing protein [Novosphingobium sp. 9]|uniref:DUF1761 domain-containing protein n=1 Tax=Novosphingobium sp. 9 TaxID=2025349 RepID=UPI0021B55C54|nr:DUF1761 domain-containing protein [Novosphingobium sp. 9]